MMTIRRSSPLRLMKCLVLLLALSLLYGCGAVRKGDSTVTQSSTKASSVVVTPATSQIRVGDTQQFRVTILGPPILPGCADNAAQSRRNESQDEGTQPLRPCAHVGRMKPGVIWSVNGVTGGNATVGTIDANGVYRTPAIVPSPNSVRVAATGTAGPSMSGTASLTLYNPVPVVTSISPTKVSVGAFTLTVNGGNFAKGAQVSFAGEALHTTFRTATQLVATVTATQSQVGDIQVFVRNPDPGSASTAAPSIQVIQPSDASQVASQDPAGIFDGQGNFDATAYVKMAKAYGTPTMITERFGSPWTAYHQKIAAPTWSQASSIKYVVPTDPAEWFYYSRGVPCTADDYSANYAQVAYVTDSAVAASRPGVDGIQTLDKAECLWAGQPQLHWAMGSGHNGHPTVTLRPDIVARQDPYGMPQQPVEVTRAYGAPDMTGCSYMVFQGQVVCGEAGNTAQDFYYFKPFPANFVPTAASVTNNGEFLLVTGWNTDSYRGQLAVIAIGSSKPSGTFWGYEWAETYPGFRNFSLPVFNKLLGIINLPGMAAPTAVEAVGNWVFHGGIWLPGARNPGQFPLSNQANWKCFVDGACVGQYDTRGFALVASRYERKVLMLDLSPLFETINEGMFGSWNQFRTNVANIGTSAGQWPPTFAERPSETPAVVKTMEFDSEVTAISASIYPDNRAFIATEDGTLHIWDADGLQTGTGIGTNASEVYALKIGRNVTRIAYMKHWLHGDYFNGMVRYQYIALSRGDKTVTWIDMSSGVPKILRVLSDSRLVDPISVEDNNNHGTQSDLIDIADYGDKNVKGYRYGPIIFWTAASSPPPVFGMGPGGLDPFEYEGAYATPTGPFSISGENVP